MLWARRLRARLFIRRARRCPQPDSRCAIRHIAAGESLKTGTVFTPSSCNFSFFSIPTSSVSLIAHCSVWKTIKCPVHRKLQRDLRSLPCLHTAAAATRLSSERDPSVHHIQTPALTLPSFSLAQRCMALLAAVVSSSMVVLTTNYSPRVGQSVPSVIRPLSCSSLITLHIGAHDEVLWCSSFSLIRHVFAILAVNRCYLASKIIHAGGRPDCLSCAHCRVVGSEPRMDLGC
jgi:hypothetical protein